MREMKSSGVEWLGKIPAEWELSRLGVLFTTRNCKVSDEDYAPLSVTMGGVVPQLSHVAKSDDHANRKLVRKGDFVINSRSDRRNSCGFTPSDGSVSLINTVCVPRLGFDSRYFGYLFDSEQWADEFYSWGHGIVADLWTTSWNEMKRIMLPVPPLDEQQRIADYLDAKCGEIDRAIEAAEKSIEEYKAYKESIVSHAVTKGLEKHVEMKDSGVEWLGNVPKSWKILPSKQVFFESKAKRNSTDERLTPSQNYGVVNQLEYMRMTGSKIVLADKGLDDWKHVEPNDFIISLRSFQGGLEMSRVIGCVTWHYIVIRTKKPICFDYFRFVFKSTRYIDALRSTCQYLRDGQDLRFSNFIQVPLPIPPIEEQQRIADYLDERCSQIDRAIAAKKAITDDLKMYKQSLIYEVVTGKREV